MAEPYIGQISIFGFNFAPAGWAFCQGQLLPISQNVPLFAILGTTYGGDGTSTFALPNLQGIPIGAGQGPRRSQYELGDAGGKTTVALTESQMPLHGHAFNALTEQATSGSADGNQLARAFQAQAKTDNVANFYSANPDNARTALAPNAIVANGSGQPHNNMQPYLVLNFCLAMQGVTPPREGAPAARTPFLGEISICAFSVPPPNWALCEGQMLQVASHQALFSLLGTSYGGDGMRTFALPDLRGRAPLAFDGNNALGQIGGEEFHTLSDAEMPSHGHALMADAISTTGIGNMPSVATVLGRSSGVVVPGDTPFSADLYSTDAANAALGGQSIGTSGGGQAHENRMPSLVVSFCINMDPNAPFPPRS
jgi:microcystin-dependent protein